MTLLRNESYKTEHNDKLVTKTKCDALEKVISSIKFISIQNKDIKINQLKSFFLQFDGN